MTQRSLSHIAPDANYLLFHADKDNWLIYFLMSKVQEQGMIYGGFRIEPPS